MQKAISSQNLRIGFGYDIHRLERGRKLILGGVEIPYKYGLYGHSDADVVIHSISDAILGACAGEDIGVHFPPTDKKYKDISSRVILEKVCKIAKKKKYKILNIDLVIVAEEPKINIHREKMKNNIAKIIGISPDCANIKATTNEGIGDIGTKKAIACYSVVLLAKGSGNVGI